MELLPFGQCPVVLGDGGRLVARFPILVEGVEQDGLVGQQETVGFLGFGRASARGGDLGLQCGDRIDERLIISGSRGVVRPRHLVGVDKPSSSLVDQLAAALELARLDHALNGALVAAQ